MNCIVKFLAILCFIIAYPFVTEANNVRIKGDVRVIADDISVDLIAPLTLTVEWDNSWRDIYNYDAVYLFLKYKVDGTGEKWHHLYLADAGHTLTSSDYAYELKNTTAATDHNEGLFLYRSKDGTGTASVTLHLNWKITSNTARPLEIADFEGGKVQISAMAVEMVYIPRGGFRIGDTYANRSFRNNYLTFPEEYDLVPSARELRSSTRNGGPSPYLVANRVCDVENGSTNAWYGDKQGDGGADKPQWVRFDFGTAVADRRKILYFAIESIPGRVPKAWKLQGANELGYENSWVDVHVGTADDWETDLIRTYPCTRAIRVNKPPKEAYRYYRVVMNQTDMPEDVAPLIKNVALTDADLAALVDNSVLVADPVLQLGTRRGLAAADGDAWPAQTTSNLYPDGYPAFYAMKYEISQDQYVQFLNKLTLSQQRARTSGVDLESLPAGSYVFGGRNDKPACRNGIILAEYGEGTEPARFACHLSGTGYHNNVSDGTNLACNFLNAEDMLAYADWCGLRPLSEMEFEKMCRPFYPYLPPRGEFAWNSVWLKTPTAVLDPGTRTEYPREGDANTNSRGIIGAPMRCGAFAVNAASREQMGATFWGVMDVSGNLSELYYNVNTQGRVFRGTTAVCHGDGTLGADGRANVQQVLWPVNHDAFTLKGGSFHDKDSLLMVSDRTRNTGVYVNMDLTPRDSTVTFRLGCIAPQRSLATLLILPDGRSTATGPVADTVCHGDEYIISSDTPQEFKNEAYTVAWFMKESDKQPWEAIENAGREELKISRLWNVNTAEDFFKCYRFKKKIFSRYGDAESEEVAIYVVNDTLMLNRLTDTVDVYNRSKGVQVDVRQKAEFSWLFGGKARNRSYAIRAEKSEVVAPLYTDFTPGNGYYILQTTHWGRCQRRDTIRIYAEALPPLESSVAVTCGNRMRDGRDLKVYTTVKIGSSCWMAENLRYAAPGSKCYGDHPENCETYGRLYDWEEAVGVFDNDRSVRGICPEGWHIPNTAEWQVLFNNMAVTLRSQQNLWTLNTPLADNLTGFSALPGGGYFFSYNTAAGGRLGYNDLNSVGWWWSSGFTPNATYTTAADNANTRISMPRYARIAYNDTQGNIPTAVKTGIFYGAQGYLGSTYAATNAWGKLAAENAVQGEFYFGVRCVKDEEMNGLK